MTGPLPDIPTKQNLCLLPTPLHPLPRASARLSAESPHPVQLWIKRDDLTGFALGGNKGRKLEFLIAQAIASRADTIVSSGATQSNFLRQLAAACAVANLRCVAATMHAPYESPDRKPPAPLAQGGNPDLDHLFNLERHLVPDGTWAELEQVAEDLAQTEEFNGRRVHRLPLGGSSPLAALAFVLAAQEIAAHPETQARPFDHVVTASSSGSTHVGLATAFHQSQTQVLGVSADPEPEILDDLLGLSARLAQDFPPLPALDRQDIRFDLGHVGPGYGVPSPEGQAAAHFLAQTEGVALDPVYSAKAFAALLHHARQGQISGKILFYHTGGLPILHARPLTPPGPTRP